MYWRFIPTREDQVFLGQEGDRAGPCKSLLVPSIIISCLAKLGESHSVWHNTQAKHPGFFHIRGSCSEHCAQSAFDTTRLHFHPACANGDKSPSNNLK